MIGRDSIYVQVFADHFVVRNVDSGASEQVRRNMEFASPRMLIADFTTAAHQLKEAVKKVRRGLLAPDILLHPQEHIEGGVTQVERRVFVELGLGSGAARAAVWVGNELGPEGVKKAIRDYKH